MSLELPTPESFPAFPYDTPYSIQVDLMRHLYTAIEGRKIAIVESPTGTGKTLSLLCGSLTWLAHEKDRARKGQLAALASGDEVDWVVAQTVDRHRRALEAEELEYEARLAEARKREALLKRVAKGRVTKRPKLQETSVKEDEDDAAFLPEDEEARGADDDNNLSPAVRALMEKLNKGRAGNNASEAEPVCTKIYYASRTHSQLTQILPELRKLKLTPVRLPPPTATAGPSHLPRKRERDDEESDIIRGFTRTVTLGSRKQLCINEDLKKRGRDLDEGCRELLGEKKEKRCQHLPPVDEDTRMTDFRDQILASPKNIEDLAEAGRIAHTCPYFASRRAIPQAELVTLPYNLLLSRTAREALGIDLTNQIVIIDEAHNLISTLLSLSAVRLSMQTLTTSLEQVSIYYSKFRDRLSARHALHIKRLVAFLTALKAYAVEWGENSHVGSKKATDKTEVMTVGDFVQRLGRKVEGINLLEIEAYLRESKIARKISGYSDKAAIKAAGNDPAKLAHLRRGATPPLHVVEAYLLALSSANDDGRVTLAFSCRDGGPEVLEMKYQHLNPATHFREITDVARSIILAGGTMSPMSDFTSQLFSHIPAERLSTFSCGHIVPESNLQTIVMSKGPRGGDLAFKFGNQGDPKLIAELGQILLNFTSLVPGGLVVFFPSYKFLNAVKSAWETQGLLQKLNKKKKVFLEPQDSSTVEETLAQYSQEVHRKNADGKACGALLLAVIGAKLSEGLNFSDDLARCVVIIGLPFANLASPELQERMKYVDHLRGKAGASTELYTNMCMNAVNQSIGRAIRHRADWASLVLIDCRYATATIHSKLPRWIGDKKTITVSFGQAIREMGQFFKQKRI
ncbi:hypothetical protein PLICRDRAFT_697066 [Plicaturopsis crispa FD-325 SS-3]|nr:hypothetical protein PLICRDRAFT_697066 [Plicaturopsis crispa FD-325 SS-3]